jgi:hypothetical protein
MVLGHGDDATVVVRPIPTTAWGCSAFANRITRSFIHTQQALLA